MHSPMFTIWHVQEGTIFFQDEVISLEETSFFFFVSNTNVLCEIF
jgi:hypothetical protein